MIPGSGCPGHEVPQRVFLRSTTRTTSNIKPPTSQASSHVIRYLPLNSRVPRGKSGNQIVRDWQWRDMRRHASPSTA
jgi:hypothetical protein